MASTAWMANVPASGLNQAFKPNQRSRVKEQKRKRHHPKLCSFCIAYPACWLLPPICSRSAATLRHSASCELNLGGLACVNTQPVTSPTRIELMFLSSQPAEGLQPTAAELMRRRPLRVTSTLPWHLVQRLQNRADLEGRSLSNLIAHLLELAG